MESSSKFLTRMSLFVVVVIAIIAALAEQLLGAFMANPAINGTICFVLLVGLIYAYRRVFDLKPEVRWIRSFQRREQQSAHKAPRLMAPAAKLLARDPEDEGPVRLSGTSMRSVLDGIATRLEESREVSRYLTGILVLLGLLGTFYGLLDVLPAIANTIRGLTVDGSDTALMFDELKAGLEGPLQGMATAFSSSLFGLAGSLVLGFLDLQAGQAQTRFYNDVEDWLASVTRLSRASEDGFASPSAYMTALMEQTADGIDRLTRSLKRASEERKEEQNTLRSMAEAVAMLADRISTQSTKADIAEETRAAMLHALETMAAKELPLPPAPEPALDEASRQHIRNLDLGVKRLADLHSQSGEMLVDEIRSELKLLSRTLSTALVSKEGKSSTGPKVTAAPKLKDDVEKTPSFLSARRPGDKGQKN